MNFEKNAVESDYDEEYDEKTVYMQQGKAILVREEIQPLPRARREPSIDIYEYRGGYADRGCAEPQETRQRRCVQLPIDRPAEESSPMQEDEQPILNLPKGGWVVNKIKAVPIQSIIEIPATLSTRPASGEVTERPQSAPRGWIPRSKWKNITNEVLSVQDEEPAPVPVFQQQAARPRVSPAKVETAPQMDAEKRKNTKICRFVEIKTIGGKITEVNKCRSGGTCTYAHNLASWNPLICRFQNNCRNFATCTFKHTQETKEDYHERIKKMGAQ
jgi:hypothetical protein